MHATVLSMRNVKKQAIVAIFAIVGLAVCAALSIRAQEHQLSPRTPDSTHKHQVFASYPLTEEFTALSHGLSAVGVYAESSNPEATAHVVLRDIANDRIVLQQDVPVKNLRHISIPRQAMSAGKRYSITISAEDLAKAHAIKIAYQSDATLDPTSIVTQAGVIKQGSLGLIEYERPTIALQLTRWLLLPHQRGLWLGVIICVLGYLLRFKHYREKNLIKKDKRLSAEKITSSFLYYCLAIFIVIIAMYWPATHTFFYFDDLPILARVPMMIPDHLLQFFTPIQYLDPDSHAKFGFYFWRPISFAIYPLLLHFLVPLNPSIYYLFNIIFLGLTGVFLFYIGNYIFKSKPAALFSVAIWASSSSKLGLVYWWSSAQDILASMFAMASIALYLFSISNKKRIWLIASLVTYLLGIFSKEYVIVVPIILFFLHYIDRSSIFSKQYFKQTINSISPFIISAGIFLILNTIVLSDPATLQRKANDPTYDLILNPQLITRNIIIYSSATVEAKLWPESATTFKIENWLNKNLSLTAAKTSGPYYPGLIAICLIIMILLGALLLRKKYSILLFGSLWWFLLLGPILLLANDWRPRWLTLSIFGLGIIFATIIKGIPVKEKIRTALLLCCTGIVAMHGFDIFRSNQLTRFYREQSNYVKTAYTQLRTQEKNISPEKRIVIIGVAEDQYTTMNAYLFRLYAKNPNADIIYAATMPEKKEQGDVIINMTGIIPYYPESEK